MSEIPKRFLGVAFAGLLLLVAAGYWAHSKAAPSGPHAGGEGVPVKVARAQVRDVPRYLSGIGTVQAFNTVSIRARIDGEIRRVQFREGQDVRRGDVLVELDARPFEAQLRSAVAQREKDEAQLENAKVDLGRYEFLAKTGSGVQQVLDTERALVRQLQAATDSDAAQVDVAQLQVQYATIRAPIDGRTGARLVDAGNMVHATDTNPLVVLTQVHPIAATFSLPQEALPELRAARRRGVVPVAALGQEGATVLDHGELTLIDNQIDPATGTIRCKATFPNAGEPLWPGQFVGIRIQLGVIAGAVLVPASALQTGPGGSYVYFVEHDVAKLRPVAAGAELDGDVSVTKGLVQGELVVTEGQFQLEPGARVAIRK